jgi:mRNA interferase MazF
MPIHYPVGAGTILLCNYDTGFREPEMVKRRPAVVVSPRLPFRNNLCAVVPLSTTEPARIQPYQCRIKLAEPLPKPWTSLVVWAKSDMVATVGFFRLDFFRTERDQYGKRKYLHPKLNAGQMQAVYASILCGFGLGELTKHLSGPI